MKWIITHHDYGATNPIMHLLVEKDTLIKNTDTNLTPDFFVALPTIEKSDLSIIESKFKNGASIYEAFSVVKDKFFFSEKEFSSLSKLADNSNTLTQFVAIATLYNIISYIIDDKAPRDEKNLINVLKIFNSSNFSEYNKELGMLFIELMNIVLEDAEFAWTKESLLMSIQFLAVNKSPINIPIDIFFQLIRKAFDLNDEYVINNFLEVIMHMIYEKRYILSEQDVLNLVSELDPLLQKFNPVIIKFIALLSSNGYVEQMRDRFVMLTSIFIAAFKNLTPFLTEEDFFEHEPPKTERSDFHFHSCSPKEFETGFNIIDINKVMSDKNAIELMSDEQYEKTTIVFNALQMADQECTNRFLTALTKTTEAYIGYDYYYDMFLSTMFLVSELSVPKTLKPISTFFLSEVLFSPKMLAFSEYGISEGLKYLRTMALKVLAMNDPELLLDVFVCMAKYPYLAAEIIIHISAYEKNIDYNVFTSEIFIHELSIVVSSLWNSFDESEYAKLAFHSTMSFVFNLLEERHNIASKCFSITRFCRMFTNFCCETTLYKNIIFTIRNYLLKEEKQNTSSISIAINEMYEKFAKLPNEYESAAKEIGNAIIYSFSHNPKLSAYFEPPIDSLLKFAITKPSEQILTQLLKLFSVACQSRIEFKLSAKRFCQLIKVMKGMEAENRELLERGIYLSLINICGESTALTPESLFLIRVPSFLPVFFAGFENEKVESESIDFLIKLCKYSATNSKLMHHAGVDTILLQYIRSPEKEICFRGCSFSLAHPDIEKVFTLLWLLTKEESSNNICLKCMDLMVNPPNIEMASKILAAQVAEVNASKVHEFSLSDVEPFAYIEDLPSTAFNKKFSFCFWIKVDLAMQETLNDQLNILEITNKSGQTFTLYLSRGSFYFRFINNGEDESKDVPSTKIGEPKTNEWCFCTFICQRSSTQKSLVGLFVDNSIIYCSESNAMMFEIESTLNYKFGGSLMPKIPETAVIGTFGLSLRNIPESELIEIARNDESSINEKNGFVFNTNQIDQNIPLPQSSSVTVDDQLYKCDFTQVRKPVQSLHYMLGKDNHLLELIPCFDPERNIPTGFLEIAIGLIKLTLKESTEAQKNFCGFPLIGLLLEKSSDRLTYQLYMAFYSILEVLSSEDCIMGLFDGIIMNCNIWLNTKFFTRIVGHWGRIIIAQYPKLFNRKGMFFSIITSLDSGINSMVAECPPQLISNVTSFLLAAGSVYISSKEIVQIFNILMRNIAINNKEMTLSMLTLIQNFPHNTSKAKRRIDNQNILISLVNNEDPLIVVEVIKALSNYASPEYTEVMLACAMQIAKHPKEKEIFKELCNIADRYNGVFFLCSALCLSMSDEDIFACSEMLARVAENETVVNDELWFVFPLIIALQLKGEGRSNAIKFIRHYIGNNPQEVPTIIDTTLFLAGLIHTEPISVGIPILHDMSFVSSKEIALLTFKCFFFIFTDNVLDPVLGSEFINSEFANYCSSYTFREQKITSPVFLDQFLTVSLTTFKIKFCSSAVPQDILDLVNPPAIADYQANQTLYRLLNEIIKHRMMPETLSQTDVSEIYIIIRHNLLNNAKSISARIHDLISHSQERITTSRTLDHIPAFKKEEHVKVSMLEGYTNYMTAAHIQDATVKPSTHLGYALSPYLTSLSIDANKLFNIGENDLLNLFEVDYSESSIISLPAKQLLLGEKRNVVVFFSNDKIQVISSKTAPLFIMKSDISFIIQRPPTSIEIFLNCHESLYFDFSPLTTDFVLENFEHINEDLVNQSLTLPMIFDSMKRWSNFEVLLLMDLFSGRSFHTEGKEPQISMGSFDQVPYYDFCCAFRSSFAKIVEKRIELEKIVLPSKLSSIIDEREEITTIDSEYETKLNFKHSEIKLAVFFDSHLAVFTTNKVFIFVLEENKAVEKCYHDFSIKDTSGYAVTDKSVVIKDRVALTITKINEELRIYDSFNAPEIFVADKNLKISLFNKCEVKVGDMTAIFPETVVCIAGSCKSAVFAVGTELCNIFVHSTERNEFFSAIKLEHEPKNMLVTDCFSVIVIDTDGEILFYTANGEFISSIKMKCRAWCKFDVRGIDFVVLVDSSNRVWYKVIGTEGELHLIGEVKDEVLCVDVTTEGPIKASVITRRGIFIAFPLNFVF